MLQYNYSNKSNKSGTLHAPSSSALEISPLVPVTSSSPHTVVSSLHSYSDSSLLTSSTLHWYESSSCENKEARLSVSMGGATSISGHILLNGSSAGSLLDPNVIESQMPDLFHLLEMTFCPFMVVKGKPI